MSSDPGFIGPLESNGDILASAGHESQLGQQPDVTSIEREVNARLRELGNLAPDAIIVLDSKGQITYANQQANAVFGYSGEELTGKPVEQLIPAGLHLAQLMHHAAYSSTPTLRSLGRGLQLVGRRFNGSEFPVEINLGCIELRGATNIIASCRDMTERTRLEEALRLNNQQLERTFEAMSEGVYIFDAAGELVKMNSAARTLAAYYSRAELEGWPWQERVPPIQVRDSLGEPVPLEAWPMVRVLHGETITNLEPAELHVANVAGDALIQSVTGAPLRDAAGQIVGAVIVARDVTKQVRMEQELAARAQEIESIVEADADGVMLFDTEGRTLRMNSAQRRLLGYDVACTTASNFLPELRSGWFHISDANGQLLQLEEWPIYRVLRGETFTGPQAVDMRLRTLDGQEKQVSVSGAPVVDREGRIIGGVTSTRDVTVQRQMEQERSDILRVVTHDLANPLASIKTYLQMQQRRMERGQPVATPDEKVLATLTQGVVRMQRLLDDMRVVVGLEAHELSIEVRPCDLGVLCRQEMQGIQMASERLVQVKLPAEPIVLLADPDRIGQVLGNLLSNADKYSPVGRPVTLTVELEPGDPQPPDQPPLRQARVQVRDEGPGISPDEQSQIWTRFHRVAHVQARPGTGGSLGLGLYISRQIIERHGGSIGVKSAPGGGSTFWFTLPITNESSV